MPEVIILGSRQPSVGKTSRWENRGSDQGRDIAAHEKGREHGTRNFTSPRAFDSGASAGSCLGCRTPSALGHEKIVPKVAGVLASRRSRTKEISIGREGRKGRDESERQRAESQRIVAARPLCRLQYPVAYLSRLQRILPAARWKLCFKAANAARPLRWLGRRHVPLGAARPLLRVGKRTAGARVASSPDSDLEAFSHNPAHGSFAPLAFQPSAMTNCANQRFLSY